MIRRLTGTLVEKFTDSVLIDCGGIGYIVTTTSENLKQVSPSQKITIWTHHAFREDSQDLYGFIDRADLDFFKLLITVSGIGPKTAIGIMGTTSADTLRQGIVSNDPVYLAKISGIGKKTAEKIVFELSSKIEDVVSTDTHVMGQEGHDVIDALTMLGYGEREIREVLKKLDTKESAQTQIKKAMSLLSKK